SGFAEVVFARVRYSKKNRLPRGCEQQVSRLSAELYPPSVAAFVAANVSARFAQDRSPGDGHYRGRGGFRYLCCQGLVGGHSSTLHAPRSTLNRLRQTSRGGAAPRSSVAIACSEDQR